MYIEVSMTDAFSDARVDKWSPMEFLSCKCLRGYNKMLRIL